MIWVGNYAALTQQRIPDPCLATNESDKIVVMKLQRIFAFPWWNNAKPKWLQGRLFIHSRFSVKNPKKDQTLPKQQGSSFFFCFPQYKDRFLKLERCEAR